VKNVEKLIELAEQLPDGLSSDWQDTNHYELHGGKDYWWLMLLGVFDGYPKDASPCDTEEGKRLGLIMDIAARLRLALPELKRLSAVRP